MRWSGTVTTPSGDCGSRRPWRAALTMPVRLPRRRSVWLRAEERRLEAFALYLLAEIACLHRPVVTRAVEEFYDGRITLAEGLGMRPAVAHCHLGLGKLYRRTGKRQEAHEHLTTATTMYREMDMMG
jgi:hypothetical protein